MSPGREVELRLIDDLRTLAADLRGISERTQATARDQQGLDSSAFDRLTLISRHVPNKLEDLNRVHRARISQLMASDRRAMGWIAFVYLIFLLVGGTLTAVASISFKRNITMPLRKLARAAERIAEGRLDEHVPIPSKDEIGQLSQAFNIMADRLQTHERRLQEAHGLLVREVKTTRALYQIGVEISSLHQVDRVLQSVVERARDLLGVEVSAICLRGSGEEFFLKASSGPADAFSPDARSSSWVPASPEPWEEMGRPACPFVQERYVHSRLAAPIRQEDQVVGFIGVFQADARTFAAEDEELLRALATQAAIAIEHARLHEELQSLATIEERARLGREIHDGLAQCLSFLYTKLRRVEERIPSDDEKLDAIRDLALITEHAYDDLRQAIFDLRVMASEQRGFVSALAEYIREFTLQTGIQVDLKVADGAPNRLSLNCEVQLIRVLQEALANVRKHSQTSQAWVRVEAWNGGVKLTVEDHGRGCDPALLASPNPLHFGLQTMRERAESLGGKLEFHSSAGKGMRVVATLPEDS